MNAPPLEPPSVEPAANDPSEPPPASAAARRPARRLARRADGRLLGGVAGGLADCFGIDIVLVRLAFVVTAFFGGLGVIAYLIGWIVLPQESSTGAAEVPPGDRKQLLGYVLVAIGLAVIGGRIGWSFDGNGAFWPLVLIAGGAAVLWLRTRDVGNASEGARAPSPVADSSSPTPPSPAPPAPGALATLTRTEPIPASSVIPTPARPERARSFLGALTWCALLILAGGAWVLDATEVVDVDLGVMFALALALVGVALLVSAWIGRARGLIALGMALVMIVGGFALVDVPLRGGIGDRTHVPTAVAAVAREYRLAIGTLSIDLRAVDLAGTRRHVHAQVGIGALDVRLPPDVRVVVDSHVGIGDMTAFGRQAGDCCRTDVRLLRPGLPGAGTVILVADVGVGHIDITREESMHAPS